MTLLADLLCGGGKPRLRAKTPPRPLRSPCVTPQCICQATGIPPFHGFCKCCSLDAERYGGGGKRREGVNAPPRPLQPPCVTPRCICQTTGIPPLHGFCKYLSLPFPRRGRYGGGGKRRGRGQCPSPLSACFPEIRGSHWLPAVIDVADMAVPTPVRTPTGCAGCRTSVRRCPRIFVPAGGGGSSWWGSAPRSRCSRALDHQDAPQASMGFQLVVDPVEGGLQLGFHPGLSPFMALSASCTRATGCGMP
jgi:hypothetical protein